jgi:hypothetical protein
MKQSMASLSKFVVILAILILPSRLLSQVHETREQAPAPQPAQTAAVPLDECEVRADDLCCRRPWWDPFGFASAGLDPGTPRESIFVFGGHFTRRSMGHTFDVFNVTYDDGNWLGALGYQRYHWSSPHHFHWGWEVGLAGRFGDGESIEVWGGPTVRHDGITIANRFMIKPSLTAGLSAVTEAMGHELRRQVGRKGDASFLFYLGPDFSIATTRNPNVEFFYRLHHRCGARRTLGGLSEGYNANVVGVRFRY